MKRLVCSLVLLSMATFSAFAEKKFYSGVRNWRCFRWNSPWNGLTDSAEAEAKTKHIRAVRRSGDKRNLVKPFSDILFVYDYVLMRLPDEREVTVNAIYFSDLERIDVTQKLNAGPSRIGTARPEAMSKFTPAQILEILVKYEIVQTYIHQESAVSVLRETKTIDYWTAEVQGQHTFYTNKKNVRDFSFRFTLDLKSGEMSLTPWAL